MPLKYSINWAAATPYYVTVNIYAEDGTVAIAHSGVEVGQGINTKVNVHAQLFCVYSVCACAWVHISVHESMHASMHVWVHVLIEKAIKMVTA